MIEPRIRSFCPAHSFVLVALASSGCVYVHDAPSCISAPADAAVAASQTGAHPDAGASPADDAGTIDAARPDSALPNETREDAAQAVSGSDAALFFDAARAPDADAGLLFAGSPVCETLGFKLLGAIDGKPVEEQASNAGWASSGQTHTLITNYGNESDGGAIINMHLAFGHDLVPGEVTPITNGTLRNVVADPRATYCVTAGQVGLLPLQPAQAVSYQLLVTGVQASVNGECTGPLLTADLRGCLRAGVAF